MEAVDFRQPFDEDPEDIELIGQRLNGCINMETLEGLGHAGYFGEIPADLLPDVGDERAQGVIFAQVGYQYKEGMVVECAHIFSLVLL